MRLLGLTTEEATRLQLDGLFHPEGDTLTLDFVGLIVQPTSVWLAAPPIAVPKDESVSLGQLRSVRNILETYFGRSAARRALEERLATVVRRDTLALSCLREVEIFASLFQWTTEYGIHEIESIVRSEDPTAMVDWPSTFAASLPLRTKSGVLFHAPIAYRGGGHVGTLGLMQSSALCHLARKYFPLSNQLAFPYNDVLDLAADVASDAPVLDASWRDRLLAERHASNRDHEQELIAILQQYADQSDSGVVAEIHGVSLYGMTAFELIWEDVCRVAFGGESELAANMSNPAYLIDGVVRPTTIQRPDIMLQSHAGTLIVDAKYYPGFPERLPGLDDVRKQLFYGESYFGETACLAFLFPVEDSERLCRLGSVAMYRSGARDTRFESVVCIGVPWSTACEAYLGGREAPGLRADLESIAIS
ncbi:MAG: LlaJI family restriction endonuclease [Candidatus Binataceae bacterium]